MFTRKTVFILGAGASWHYGYPTGEVLVKEVIKKTDRVIAFLQEDEQAGRTNDFVNLHYIKDEFSKPDYHSAGKVLKKALANFQELSQKLRQINPPVIDYFLKEHPS